MPAKIHFPAISGNQSLPPVCVACKSGFGAGEFLAIGVGAILHHDESRTVGGPDDLMAGYFHIARQRIGPNGRLINVDIVDDVSGGQADLLFCSPQCLRDFFSSAVDELERRSTDSQ